MANKEINKKLDKLLLEDNGKWKENIQWRTQNKDWLKYSRKVAIKVNLAMKDKGISKDDLKLVFRTISFFLAFYM